MGFPIITLSQTYESMLLFGNSLFILLLFIDVVRMYILTVYAPNAILTGQSRNLFIKVLIIPIVGILLYLLTYLDELQELLIIFTSPDIIEVGTIVPPNQTSATNFSELQDFLPRIQMHN